MYFFLCAPKIFFVGYIWFVFSVHISCTAIDRHFPLSIQCSDFVFLQFLSNTQPNLSCTYRSNIYKPCNPCRSCRRDHRRSRFLFVFCFPRFVYHIFNSSIIIYSGFMFEQRHLIRGDCFLFIWQAT